MPSTVARYRGTCLAEAAMRWAEERLERAAEEALHEAATPAVRAALGLQRVPVADGLVMLGSMLPASAIVTNRTIGLGLERPITAASLHQVMTIYREAGIGRFFLHLHPDADTPELRPLLAATGFAPARGWQKFSRDLDGSLPEPVADVDIREVGDVDAVAFAEIVCDAFDLGEIAVPWFATLPTHPDWRTFLAYVDGMPAGAGALFIQDGLAWTDFGATAPAFRGRGLQFANLAHRVRYASEAGCRRIYTCTGEAVPGEAQHSYANILRCGFNEDYVRTNWAPAA